MSKHHSSFFPEMDEVQKALKAEANPKGLYCSRCQHDYTDSADAKPGYYCMIGAENTPCNGMLVLLNTSMITLTEETKKGKKSSGQGQLQGGWGNNNNYSGGGTGGTVYTSHHHPGDKVIFEWEHKQLFASNMSSLKEKSGKWQLVIDLAGVVNMPNNQFFIGVAAPQKFKDKLTKHIFADAGLPCEVLRLHWTDYGIPPVSLGFWFELWDLLPEKTVIACQGGHGRTGTCIAALMIAAGTDYYTTIAQVRAEHCMKAVESLQQELYLHRIYQDYLKLIIDSPHAKHEDKLSAKESLDYAVAHVPNPKSSYGEHFTKEEPQSTLQGQVVVDQSLKGSIYKTISGTSTREDPDGTIYVRECIHPGCCLYECKIQNHQGWHKVEQDEMASVGGWD